MTEHTRGFTLIETLVAITIVAVAVAGPLFTASRSIVAAEIADDQLTASYLAQEAIEYVRMMRDDAFLDAYQAGGSSISDTAWTEFVSGSNDYAITGCKANVCTLDPTRSMGTGSGLSLETCSGSCGPLYLASGVYTQQTGIGGSSETPFTRTVQVVTVSSTEERVTASVSWTYHGTSYSVVLNEHLTPWQ